MKQIGIVVLLALFSISSAFAGQAPATKKIAKATAAKPKAAAPPPAASTQPKLPFEAYAVADAADGKILEGLNVNLRWPQASLTKLMLAVVVMDQIERGALHLSDRVTVSRKAEGMGGSQVFLKAGETFSLDELMRAALVESANDAAFAVAEHTAGSSDEFVKRMNAKARALGMPDTEFHCVHGLPPAKGGVDNITTCNDMIRLAREALQHPQILEWTSIEHATFRGGTLSISNKNKLVGRVPGVDGLKTGYTRRAGFNIVATAKTGDRRLIVVVLGSPESRVRNGFAADKFREHLLVQPTEPEEPVETTASGG
ncbi:MAG: D-alanyl-D-alanine carboxypeptidase [Desulfobacterales bacterium]|jgi:D-alanyl-D-alanine carboxypeptidase (penicillin-binding protein 5/6)|nr:D-alanyl-D-alanine carboxypeptidase [Desulfobacterales bacterium]